MMNETPTDAIGDDARVTLPDGKAYPSDNLTMPEHPVHIGVDLAAGPDFTAKARVYRNHNTGEVECVAVHDDDGVLRKIETFELVRELRRRKVLKPVNASVFAYEEIYAKHKSDENYLQSLWHSAIARIGTFMSDPQQRKRFVAGTIEDVDALGDTLPNRRTGIPIEGRRLTARIEVLDLTLIGAGRR